MYDPIKPYKKQILSLIKETWETPHVSVIGDTYPIIRKKFSYPEVDHTDGIGTKGIFHWRKRSFKNAVMDALAMNLNDLALARAVPYKLQNHITIPEDDKEAISEIIGTISEECKKRDIAITGGETSVHDDVNGIDISLTVSGFLKDYQPNKFREGDVLIGIQGNGLHSNGFTKVREVLGEELIREEFTRPTPIYSDFISRLLDYDIHGMMHITGGAFTKLKDLLENSDAVITRDHDLKPQSIFKELYERGVSDEDMYKTFNCGTGFVFGADGQEANEIISEIKDFKSDIIGEIVPGHGKVRIESKFSKKEIEY